MNSIYKIVITNSAKEDIKEAAKWYNRQKKGLGKQFLTYVKEKVFSLKTNPFICQNRYSRIRTAVLKHFPYMLHYYVDEIQNLIVIIAVFHTSRNPEIWNDRIEENE